MDQFGTKNIESSNDKCFMSENIFVIIIFKYILRQYK